MVAEDSVFRAIRNLDDSHDQWVKRTVVTVDLADGLDTYVERVTYDLDPEVLQSCSFPALRKAPFLYIPVAWRARDTFLEFDARLNSGTSLQLVELSLRKRYCEWLFWRTCDDLKVIKRNKVPDQLVKCLREYVHNGMTRGNPFGKCSRTEREIWEYILSNARVKSIYRLIGDYQPVVLCAPRDSDLSLIKLKERKNLKQPRERQLRQYLLGSFYGTVYSVSASSTKFVAPNDMRFKRVDGYALRYTTPKSPITAEVLGDGSWAHCKTDQRGDFNAWRLVMTPRRPEFLLPGFRVLLLGFFAIIFWYSFDINARSGKDVLNSFSMTVVGSVFVYYLRLLDIRRGHSLYFRWAVAFQRHGLMGAYAAVISFPFLDHFLNRAAEFLHRIFGYLRLDLEGVASFIRSDFVALAARVCIVLAVFLLLIDFSIARGYGRPPNKRGRKYVL